MLSFFPLVAEALMGLIYHRPSGENFSFRLTEMSQLGLHTKQFLHGSPIRSESKLTNAPAHSVETDRPKAWAAHSPIWRDERTSMQRAQAKAALRQLRSHKAG